MNDKRMVGRISGFVLGTVFSGLVCVACVASRPALFADESPSLTRLQELRQLAPECECGDEEEALTAAEQAYLAALDAYIACLEQVVGEDPPTPPAPPTSPETSVLVQ